MTLGRFGAWNPEPDLEAPLMSETQESIWYARPVFFVSDLQMALAFYIDTLGFVKKWHSDNGKGDVCQVDRGGCEIILCESAERRDRGRLFVELNRQGMTELRREIAERVVPFEMVWWGYDTIRLVDPDGNELLFPLDETNTEGAA